MASCFIASLKIIKNRCSLIKGQKNLPNPPPLQNFKKRFEFLEEYSGKDVDMECCQYGGSVKVWREGGVERDLGWEERKWREGRILLAFVYRDREVCPGKSTNL